MTSSRIRLGVGAGVIESAASITCDSSGATITDILDGSSALTVTNADSGNIDFTAITITYL